MRGGYQIIDLSAVEIGNETIVDNIYNTIKNYDGKPVFIITPNNSGVFAEFSNNNNMYIGAYIGSNGHLFTVSIISSNSVTITDKGQAGGSGTSNYNELSNKPAIAGTTLLGDKSLSDLGIQGELTAGNNITIQGNEISANVESMAASGVTYDHTTSGLNADDVQDAITELNSKTTSTNFTSQLSFDTGYSLVDGTIRKQGTLVVFSAEIDISQATVAKVHRLMTLPSNLRPAEYIEGSAVAIDHNGGNVIPLRIIATSGGAVVVYAANNIPADYYIEFDITYFTL